MNKPVDLGLSILELSKTLMYQFGLCKTKKKKVKKQNFHNKSFIVYIKIDDIYKDIAENVKTRFDTLNYELDRPLAKGKNKN